MPPAPRRRTTPKRLPGYISPDDRKKLLRQPSDRYPTGIRNRALIGVMLLAGLRCAEALDLTLGDVKIKDELIIVKHGKGDKPRVVPIAGTLEPMLLAYRKIRPAGDRFFLTLDGRALQPSYVRRMVKRYAAKAGLVEDAHPHMLRHTCASAWLNDEPKLSLKEVQEMLGHSRISTTELYLHTNPVEVKAKLRRR